VSEPEDFLSRWTRLKREAARAEDTARPADDAHDGTRHDETAAHGEIDGGSAPPTPVLDLSALPPIESITAATDIRAFLAPGVPAELTRAALRRAWVVDPTIRDFIGIAENQWDFTNPDTVPGFGSFGSLDDVRRLVAQVVGGLGDNPPASITGASASPDAAANNDSVSSRDGAAGLTTGRAVADATEPASPGESADVVRRNVTVAEAQQNERPDETRSPPNGRAVRGHGSALPK
jgi:hypothetical protein